MSTYTTELRFICEELAGLDKSKDYPDVNSIITIARPKIFNFSYPIFDENYKSVLEHKILKHYYTREIGAETYGLWHLWLDERMNLLMPYYNQLYKSELLEFNPFYDVDLTTDNSTQRTGSSEDTGNRTATDTIGETVEETGTQTGTETKVKDYDETVNDDKSGTSSENSTGWNLYNDTPQGGITGIENGNYLTNATKTTGEIDREYSDEEDLTRGIDETDTLTRNLADSKNTDRDITKNLSEDTTLNKTFENVEDYLQHVKGKSGGASYSKLLKEYRDTFLNIDAKVIKDLSNLFFNLW